MKMEDFGEPKTPDTQNPCGRPTCPTDECCDSADCQNLPSFREIAKIKEYPSG